MRAQSPQAFPFELNLIQIHEGGEGGRVSCVAKGSEEFGDDVPEAISQAYP